MHWTVWPISILLLLSGGWMTFDGARALIVGDYFTPASGPNAGKLGPWAAVVEAVGFEPRSNAIKMLFVALGVATLAMAGGFAAQVPWMWWGVAAVAIGGLWYLPIGTAINVIVLVLLALSPIRPWNHG